MNAPGKPINKIDLSFAKSAKLCFFGGNPWCSSTLGRLSPTEAAKPRRAIDGLAREQNLLPNNNGDMFDDDNNT